MASVPPSDLVINGLDLTTVFARYISGPKASPTGIFINGQDLCNIFAPYQIGAKANPTGIYVGGGSTDLCNIFLPLNAAVPIAPTNLTLQSITDVSASFTFSTVAGATSYLASTTTGITGASISTPLVMTGLAAGTPYSVYIRTINPYGMSLPSKNISITTKPTYNPTITTTVSDVSATIVFPSYSTLSYYSALATPTSGGSTITVTSTNAALSITGLTAFTRYNMQYLITNISGQSNPFFSSYTTAPAAPTNLSLSNITASSASLSFSTALGATSYLVTTSLNAVTISTSSGTTSPFNISGLSAGSNYLLGLQSINPISSGYSLTSFITLNTLTNAPTGLSVTNTTYNSTTITFSTVAGTTSYIATAIPTPSGTSVTAASTSYPIIITGLNILTTYNITIKSKNSDGVLSNPSSTVNTTTLDIITITGLSYSTDSSASYNRIYKFTTGSGNIKFSPTLTAQVLIVGGGGGGGIGYPSGYPYGVGGGGGGGGSVGYGSLTFYSNISYIISIADSHATSNTKGNNTTISGGVNGQNGYINEIAYGGGDPAISGGSGGGGIYNNSLGGGVITPVGILTYLGNSGGAAGVQGSYRGAGGGGGAGSAGSSAIYEIGGSGGSGYTWTKAGLSLTVGAGGQGGSALSEVYQGQNTPISFNTGNGGRGGSVTSYAVYGDAGASGILVIAFNF